MLIGISIGKERPTQPEPTEISAERRDEQTSHDNNPPQPNRDGEGECNERTNRPKNACQAVDEERELPARLPPVNKPKTDG